MTNKLFVGSLSYDLTDAQLQEHFAKAGTVLSAKVITDRYTGKGKGFGFVEMATEDEARKAMQELNNSTLAGRQIVVSEARPQENRDNRSFGGNRQYKGDRNNNRNYHSKRKTW